MSSGLIAGVMNRVGGWFVADALRAGDEAAWSDLYGTHSPRVYRFFRCRVDTDASAEELVTEVFVEAYRSIEHYEVKRQPLSAWLFGIAGEVLAAHHGAQERQPGTIAVAYPALHVRDEHVATEVRGLLAQLPPQYRSALELRYLLRLSGAEAAAAMGTSAGEFRPLLVRAVEAFRLTRGSVRDPSLPPEA